MKVSVWSDGEIIEVEESTLERDSLSDLYNLVPLIVSDRQFFQALAIRNEISEEEALEAVGPGTIPNKMAQLIDQLPEAERFSAKMLIRGATTFERRNELAEIIGSLFGWDSDDLDEFWTFASTL